MGQARHVAAHERAPVHREYLGDEDCFGQWLEDCCTRSEPRRSLQCPVSQLPGLVWAGIRPESNALLSRYLVASGFSREKTKVGRSFIGLRFAHRELR